MFRRILLSVLALMTLLASALAHLLFADLPTLDHLTENLVVPSTKILARDGRLLYEITDPAGAHHTTLPLDDIPPACRQATVAVEDASFYSNPGVDALGILRAVWINVRGGEVLSGGSTITQQVARNMLLDPQERVERTLMRKLRESILAWRLARALSKDEILGLYLNQTYYGHLAYGIDAAAQTYFGKSARDLDLAECALLAGLPQAPALFDPLANPQAAKDKQRLVLGLMLKQGRITAEQNDQAVAEQLQFAASPFPIAAPHFVFYVWSLLEAQYPPDILYSGLTVTTSLDLDLTLTAEHIISQNLQRLADDPASPPHNATDAALVALDPRTGQLLALVGSPDYFDPTISGAVNMAIAPRQPGSAIKPITYAAAFDPHICSRLPAASPPTPCPWSPATMILDVRTAFVTKEGISYVPQNYDRNFHGPVLVREALGGSLNVPAVKTLDFIGLPNMLSLAGRMGIGTLSDANRFGLALTLGGGEVRLLDLTSAFGVFANGGVRQSVVPILNITDAQGNVIYQVQPRRGERVLDERVAFLITDILSDNTARRATFGPNSILQIGRPAAVKTGTTTDFRDNWTVGYTPELAVGVWVGNADNSPMVNLSGVAGAGPIWHDFIRAALVANPELHFARPEGLVRVEVCALSGLLPTDYCPHRKMEWFIDGTQPTATDTFYQPIAIDLATGLPADAATPPERIATQVFLNLPPEALEWARAKNLPLAPEPIAAHRAEALIITAPDEATVYAISPRIPIDSQQIVLSTVGGATLRQVAFELNGEVMATDDDAPFQTFWQLSPGSYTLVAIGSYADGAVRRSEPVRFVVK